MHDFPERFLYDWLPVVVTVFFFPFYPAVAGTLWCALRLLRGRHVQTWLWRALSFFAYAPILLIATSFVGESLYAPRSGINWAYMLFGFGIGLLVDLVSMPMLIWGLWRRRKATVRETTAQNH